MPLNSHMPKFVTTKNSDRARERGASDAQRRTPRRTHQPMSTISATVDIDGRHAVIKAQHQVAEEQRPKRRRERDRASPPR